MPGVRPLIVIGLEDPLAVICVATPFANAVTLYVVPAEVPAAGTNDTMAEFAPVLVTARAVT